MNSFLNILKKCLNQDRISQKWVYEHYYVYALKIAYRYNDTHEDANIIVNDSFVKLFKSMDQFKLDTNQQTTENRFKGWLGKIIINKSIDKFRSLQNKMEFQSFEKDTYEIIDNSTKSDTLILYKEMIEYLKELPLMYQLVFNMHVIDGYTHFEIATMLEITEGTSKSNLFRAKQILQKKLSVFFEFNK